MTEKMMDGRNQKKLERLFLLMDIDEKELTHDILDEITKLRKDLYITKNQARLLHHFNRKK